MFATPPSTRQEILAAAREGKLLHVANCAEVYDVIELDMSWKVGDKEYWTLDEDDSPTVSLINQMKGEGVIVQISENVEYPYPWQTITTYRYSAAEARDDG